MLIFILSFFLFLGNAEDSENVFKVNYLSSNKVKIDGVIGVHEWDGGQQLTSFKSPWDEGEVPYTYFTAFHNRERFYFMFKVIDQDIQINEDWEGEKSILNEDRVEIFFSIDNKLSRYYGLEMDAASRLLDYEGKFYRDTNWDWECPGLELASSITNDGYIVEGSIPIVELKKMGVINKDNTAIAGVYRGEFSMINGERDTRWICWVDPKTKKPDFHIFESFGTFIFE